MNRLAKTGFKTVFICVLLLITGGATLYSLLAGTMWKFETKRFAEMAGASQATLAFRGGVLKKYVIDGERSEDTRLNRRDGPFDLVAIFYQPALGGAHRVATESFVSAYNGQMDVMLANPKRFPRSTNSALLRKPSQMGTTNADGTASETDKRH